MSASGLTPALFDRLDRVGLMAGPVIAVGRRDSALVRHFSRAADTERRMFLFTPPARRDAWREDAPPPLWEAGNVPVHLSNRDRDVEWPTRSAVPLLSPRRARFRRIDRLFPTLDPCALICVADDDPGFGAIEGGRDLIARTRPALLIETVRMTGTSWFGNLVSMAASLGYRLHDAALQPLEAPRLDVVMALPPEQAESLAELAITAQPATRLPGPRVGRIACDAALEADGLYPVETDGEASWRWSGPGRIVRVKLPIDVPGRYEVCARITQAAPGVLADVAVRTLGQPVASHLHSTGDDGLSLLAWEVTAPEGLIDIEIAHGAAVTFLPGDPRPVGLRLAGFEIRWLG